MESIFQVRDRQDAYEFILAIAKECSKVIALCQVGSGAIGYRDEYSDLDFVIALDSDDSMLEVMEYVNQKITEKYEISYFSQNESRHLQVYVLSNLLEIDIGYGCYEYAAALKPAFKVLFDHSGVVEDKMIKSREWMDNSIFGDKYKKDIDSACNSVWARMMHAAVAIHRNNYFRAIGEIEYIRKTYIDLLGDRYRLESSLNREIDQLPEDEKKAIRSTLVMGESADDLWVSLMNLTTLVFKELDGYEVAISKDMILGYYEALK